MQHSRGDFHKPEKNDDCHALAPFVMALFDGEADEIEARRARAHLLICQTCANRWLDWNRSRDLLRAVPVPAPPPLLLWRVLMACRLAAFSRHAPAKNSRFSLTRENSQQNAPLDLSAQILAHTTRGTETVNSPRRAANVRLPKSQTRPAFSALRLPHLAASALAIWLMVLQRDVTLAPYIASSSDGTQSAISTAPRDQIVRRRAVPTPETASNSRARLSFAPQLHSSAARATTSKSSNLKSASPDSALIAARVALRRGALASVPSSAPSSVPISSVDVAPTARKNERASEFSAQFIALDAARLQPAASIGNTGASLRTASISFDSPVRKLAPRRAEFALAAPVRVQRLRAARWKNSALRPQNIAAPLADSDAMSQGEVSRGEVSRGEENSGRVASPLRFSSRAPQTLRVSLPTSAPDSPRPQLLAENIEDNGRVEEMRSVVDDFRATLAPEDLTLAEDEENTG